MKRVFKFSLPHRGVVTHSLPVGATVLSTAFQLDRLQLWVECDPAEATEARTFATIFTGHDEVPKHGQYVGTTMTEGGEFVSHVYEVTPTASENPHESEPTK